MYHSKVQTCVDPLWFLPLLNCHRLRAYRLAAPGIPCLFGAMATDHGRGLTIKHNKVLCLICVNTSVDSNIYKFICNRMKPLNKSWQVWQKMEWHSQLFSVLAASTLWKQITLLFRCQIVLVLFPLLSSVLSVFFVFNVHYPSELKLFYTFLERIMGINPSRKSTCVTTIIQKSNSLRSHINSDADA